MSATAPLLALGASAVNLSGLLGGAVDSFVVTALSGWSIG